MDRRIRRVRSLLDEQYRDPPSIDELAGMVGLSGSRLAHLFRDEVGMSIRSYVVERRLAMAAMLIVQTDERISQIAYSVGFGDVSNFNHSFKRRFGMSPGEYRNEHDSHHGGDGEPEPE
jgi:AraC-like DNA-binding protein